MKFVQKMLQLQFTDDDAPIIGQGTINADTTDVIVDTTAVQSDSVIFVTPQTTLLQSLAVAQINCDENGENCTGFTVEIAESLENPIDFNWMIVNGKQEEVIVEENSELSDDE